MCGWRLLQDRLPTLVELWRRGVIRDVHQQCCVFCFEDIESASHLFASCNKTKKNWDLIFTWLDWKAVGWRAELIDNFLLVNSICKGKNRKKVSHLVWLTIAW